MRAFVQMFGLSPAHRLQLWMSNLVLFEQIAWPGLDFPSYRPRAELRLNCQVFSIGDQPTAICYLPSLGCKF